MKTKKFYLAPLCFFLILFCIMFSFAVFAVEPESGGEYSLKTIVSPENSGSVQITVDSKTQNSNTVKAKADARVTLKATEKDGYFFAYWEVDSSASYEELSAEKLKNPTINFKMKAADATFRAVFQKNIPLPLNPMNTVWAILGTNNSLPVKK